jgi:hypothetical protein
MGGIMRLCQVCTWLCECDPSFIDDLERKFEARG